MQGLQNAWRRMRDKFRTRTSLEKEYKELNEKAVQELGQKVAHAKRRLHQLETQRKGFQSMKDHTGITQTLAEIGKLSRKVRRWEKQKSTLEENYEIAVGSQMADRMDALNVMLMDNEYDREEMERIRREARENFVRQKMASVERNMTSSVGEQMEDLTEQMDHQMDEEIYEMVAALQQEGVPFREILTRMSQYPRDSVLRAIRGHARSQQELDNFELDLETEFLEREEQIRSGTLKRNSVFDEDEKFIRRMEQSMGSGSSSGLMEDLPSPPPESAEIGPTASSLLDRLARHST